MPRSAARSLVGAFSMAAFVVAAGAFGQDDAKKPESEDRVQKGEGVILRVEPVDDEDAKDKDKDEKKAARRVKITVNTNVVWRDWVRDNADLAKKPDAKGGENSIATKGQPESAVNDIVAEVGPDTNVQLRYRSSTDESNEGSRTVEKAEKKDGSPESNEVKTSLRDEKAPKMKLADLKPGLFVEVEAKKGKANRLIVIKPVGGPQTPASEAAPKS